MKNYRNEKSTLEIDFFIRDANHLVPIEVKASDNPTKSLKSLIEKPEYSKIKYGIKLAQKKHRLQWRILHIPVFFNIPFEKIYEQTNTN